LIREDPSAAGYRGIQKFRETLGLKAKVERTHKLADVKESDYDAMAHTSRRSRRPL
jgi:hypothetical protein